MLGYRVYAIDRFGRVGRLVANVSYAPGRSLAQTSQRTALAWRQAVDVVSCVAPGDRAIVHWDEDPSGNVRTYARTLADGSVVCSETVSGLTLATV